MRLRKLEDRDAPGMLEWMHDPDAVRHLSANFASKTLEDCLAFIRSSREDSENLNLAIADENDTYMGTVSLKHLDKKAGEAEFAISMRVCAMGKGFAGFAMREIIRMGHEDLGLKRVYWCVSPENVRAVRFYNKGGCARVSPEGLGAEQWYTREQIDSFLWYAAEKA